MKKHFPLILSVVLLMFSVLPCFALYNKQGIPDSSEVRKSLVQSWFTASVEQVRSNKTELYINNVGTVFQVRSEENGKDLLIIVAPQEKLAVDVYTEQGKSSSYIDVYPLDSPGSWVLLRDVDTGKPIQIRYYFAADSDVFVQFRPYGTKTVADFVVYGSFAARSVPVGIAFERLYTASFSAIQDLTKRTLPWEYSDIVPELYNPVLQMISVIREQQERFFAAEDAAYDENGEPVNILSNTPRIVAEDVIEAEGLSFSSAGFLKWIIDGLVVPLAGGYTKIEPLLVSTAENKTGSFADVKSQIFDLDFSLNWTRNLAAAALSVYSGKNYYYTDSGCDVTIEPFSSTQSTQGWTNNLGYLKDSGYSISSLKPLLYVLAVTEPGRFFLGAIRQTDATNPSSPEVHFFTESVALFPYFDSNGRFDVVVFENGQELTLDSLLKKYSDTQIHLVRVNASERFFPQ